MNAKVADLVANAVVSGRPVWTPAVIAALAALFHASRSQVSGVSCQETPAKGAGAADPAPVPNQALPPLNLAAGQEHETWTPRPQPPRSRPT